MSHRGVQGFLVAAFAAAIGHLAWNSVVGPPPVPVYWVRSDGVALAGTNSETKYLYLRRQLYLPSSRAKPGFRW